MNTIYKTILLALCMATTVTSFSAKDYEKEFKESFDITEGATVELDNRYGNMTITTHSADRVDIHIQVLVDAKNEDRADDIFDRIDIDIHGSANHVTAKTSIGESGGIWKKFSWGGGFEIHYSVIVPDHVYLNLKNKYGNVSIPDMENDVKLYLKYGNFGMGDAHDMDLILGYGNGEMGDVRDLDAEVSYGQLEVDKADDIDIDSKYSKMTIDEARDIDSDSKYDGYKIRKARDVSNDGKYDNFKIGSVEKVKIYTKYTGIDIELLDRSATIENGYSGITIDEITENLESINIQNSYSDVRIYNPNDIQFEYDLETSYGSLQIDNGTGEWVEDDHDEWARGKRKGRTKSEGKIRVKNKYGNIKLR